jgi:DNA-binding PadR family transcriptional regulator
VSPVFRHGRLRLYLLKLLDESPRHGYEVIRLLQDRFMGVYAPSPGTIYPRLARLEEDGLVTHEDVDGKKVYSITDKGREEIRSRLGDLADLEDELTESLRDVAREISEDVRDTVRTIREELASAAREFRADGGKTGRYQSADTKSADTKSADTEGADTSGPDTSGPDMGGDAGSAAGAGRPGRSGADRADDRRVREEARRRREQMRASFRAQGRSHGDWAAWAGWSGRSEWPPWASWADWASGRDEPTGEHEPAESTGAAAGSDEGTAAFSGSGAGTAPGAGTGSGAQAGSAGAERSASGEGQRARRGGQNPFSDLERMAIQFATELRAAAKQTGDLGERSLNDLRDILTDTLAKVRAEVFPDTGSGTESGEAGRADAAPGESVSHDDSSTAS